jgi:Flp pilus assembly protein TadB
VLRATTAAVLASTLFLSALLQGPAGVDAAAAKAPRLLALRGGHFGGFRPSRGFGSRRAPFARAGRRGSSHGFLRRVAKALALAYLLHLFFTHGGLSILLWVVVIGLVLYLVLRRRRRRDGYAY